MRPLRAAIYPVLGMIRRDAQLQYACGDGTIRFLRDSHAMLEYGQVARQVREIVWNRTPIETRT